MKAAWLALLLAGCGCDCQRHSAATEVCYTAEAGEEEAPELEYECTSDREKRAQAEAARPLPSFVRGNADGGFY